MQRISPLDKAGLSRLEASIVPPLVEPAPTIVCNSSMNKIAPSRAFRSLTRFFKRSSKSPRNLVPATREPRSKAKICAFRKRSGTFPEQIN